MDYTCLLGLGLVGILFLISCIIHFTPPRCSKGNTHNADSQSSRILERNPLESHESVQQINNDQELYKKHHTGCLPKKQTIPIIKESFDIYHSKSQISSQSKPSVCPHGLPSNEYCINCKIEQPGPMDAIRRKWGEWEDD